MTLKEILVKRWWLVALVGLFVIGAVNSKSKGSSSKGGGKGSLETCYWCGTPVYSNNMVHMSKPPDGGPIDLSGYGFCSKDCATRFAASRGIQIVP